VFIRTEFNGGGEADGAKDPVIDVTPVLLNLLAEFPDSKDVILRFHFEPFCVSKLLCSLIRIYPAMTFCCLLGTSLLELDDHPPFSDCLLELLQVVIICQGSKDGDIDPRL